VEKRHKAKDGAQAQMGRQNGMQQAEAQAEAAPEA
jgi:hypothetical protein